MNYRIILRQISFLTTVIGIGLFSAVPVAWFSDPFSVTVQFWICAAFCCGIGIFGLNRTKRREEMNKAGIREGFASVLGCWLVAVFLGALPFILIGNMELADAVFESASGFSTSGGTVIDDLERLPKSLLFWRCFLNWIGGIGIVVFVLLLLPLLGGSGGYQLYNAEVPGVKTSSDQVTPRMDEYARRILGIYLLLTLLCTAAYIITGMTFYDALCNALSTVSTGGFSTKNDSFAAFGKGTQWAAILFMLISSCNFTMTLKMFSLRKIFYFKDEEFRFFLLLILLAAGILAFQLYFTYEQGITLINGKIEPRSAESVLRCAFFQIVSLISTSGFVTADYTGWIALPGIMMILFLLTIFGGCGSSTSGGLKCVRVLLIMKHCFSEIRHCIFPRQLSDVRLNGKRLDDSIIRKMMAFSALYIITIMLVALFLSFLCEMDIITAFSASISSLSNVGPGFGRISPVSTYSWMTAPAKYLLALTMIIGRLEIYTFLVIFFPSFWKK